MTSFTLVLITFVYGGYVATPLDRPYDKDNCDAAGQRWIAAAAAQDLYKPRYVCLPNHKER